MESFKPKSKEEYMQVQSDRMTSLTHEYPISPWHEDVFNEFKYHLKSPVIDIGCRNGKLLDKLKEESYDAHGIELTDLALHAQKMGRQVIQHDIHDRTPYEDKFFKSAIMTHVLEHLHDPEKALREVYRILCGHLLVIFPSQGMNEEQRDRFGHYSFFTGIDDVCELLNKTDFDIFHTYS